MSWLFSSAGTNAESKGLLRSKAVRVKTEACHDYSPDMIGVVFIRYNNFIFPCTSYTPGDIIVYTKDSLSESPTLQMDAIKNMCKRSHAMKPENVVAAFFTIRNRKIRFGLNTGNASRGRKVKEDDEDYLDPSDHDAVRQALETHFEMKLEA